MTIKGCNGAVFDLDGVITETAEIHFLAWKDMFDEFLKKRGKEEFTRGDYLEYVDGKPRYDGVKSFLDSRKIDIPYGKSYDTDKKETVCGLGNRKNNRFQKIIRKKRPNVFSNSIQLVKNLKKEGVKVGIASSSKNTRLILRLAGITHLFDTVVDGIISAKEELKGKPEPDIFIRAAEKMGVRPSQSIVFEDAVSGVQAGKNGCFGLVVGVKRGKANLKAADIVVNDLDKLNIKMIEDWFADKINKKGWELEYHNYSAKGEPVREVISSVGNGYMASRGCHVTERDNSAEHYPGTYISGVFNKQPSKVHGKDVWNNDLVNCPNWHLMVIRLGRDRLRPFENEIIDYHQKMDMKRGILLQDIVVKDAKGRTTRVRTERFAGMHDRHMSGLRLEVTPIDHEEDITIESMIDGNIINNNVARYRQLNSKHLDFMDKGKSRGKLNLTVRTNNSKHTIAYSVKNIFQGSKKASIMSDVNTIGEKATFKGKMGKTVSVEKLVSICTSIESENPLKKAEETLTRTEDFQREKNKHSRAWANLWKKADIIVDGDLWTQKVLRLHIYHLLITASTHNTDLDVGMPARGLHGEGYRGHIFWDELYVLPFYNIRFPEISKALLKYRYRRLSAAERYAAENGYEGAMYPWQSADTGDEETQQLHYNPNSGEWDPDLSRRQRHVSVAIFYNFWRYYTMTGDRDFLEELGIDVMVGIARFWADIAKKEKDGKYHIDGVMGPDEFHEKIPRSKKKGLKDNAYTNIMASWLLDKAVLAARMFDEKIVASEEELSHMKDVSENLNINVKDGIIEQFEGYFKLPELDWKRYEKKYGDIHRMDRILKAEDKSPDSYKVTKQADVLMPFYNLDIEEVSDILKRLGVKVGNPKTFLRKNYRYYESRTSHGSTLSKIVHGVVSSYIGDSSTTRRFFEDSLISDISESIRPDTAEGIHTGLMAGSIDFVIRKFAGVNYHKELLEINPDMPEDWSALRFNIIHRGVKYEIELDKGLSIKADKPTEIIIRGKKRRLQKGKERRVSLSKKR
ncbi:MAG: beta-phosphoglucomutase family hydrolase [Candidatus Woesearchaeota archaeon]